MKEYVIKVHDIRQDGLPRNADGDIKPELVGRLAFIFDGCIVSGWDLSQVNSTLIDGLPLWEANSDVGDYRKFGNVTHWVEFPISLLQMTKNLDSKTESLPGQPYLKDPLQDNQENPNSQILQVLTEIRDSLVQLVELKWDEQRERNS